MGRVANARRRRWQRQATVKYFDYSLLAVVIFLVCFGLVMLYSSSAYGAQIRFGDSMHFFRRQVYFALISIPAMIIVSKIDYHIYVKLAVPIYFIAMFAKLLVLTPLGRTVSGARRWLDLPFGLQMQPSEITKLAIILLIPLLACRLGKRAGEWRGVVQILVWGGAASVAVFFFTDNLSTAIIVMGITCVLIFVIHPRTLPFVAITVAAGLSMIVGLNLIMAQIDDGGGNFRMRRIAAWLRPYEFMTTDNFQTMQGLYAIGSGGFFGKGLGNSAQNRIIPEVQNDMIFAIIGEELGVFGAIVVLVLFGMLLYRLLFIARNAPDIYGSLVVTGIFVHIAIQVILNIAVVLRIIPTTGVGLPFISSGGTALLFLMLEMGIALSVSNQIKFEE